MKKVFRTPKINKSITKEQVEQNIKSLGCSHVFQPVEKGKAFQCRNCQKIIRIVPKMGEEEA